MVTPDGVVWDIVRGESERGDRLVPVAAESLYWFAWLEFNPLTRVLERTGTSIEPVQQPIVDRDTPGLGAPGALLLIALLAVVRGRRGSR